MGSVKCGCFTVPHTPHRTPAILTPNIIADKRNDSIHSPATLTPNIPTEIHHKSAILNLVVVEHHASRTRDICHAVRTTLNIAASTNIKKVKQKIARKLRLKLKSFTLSIAPFKPLSKLNASLLDYDVHDGDVLIMTSTITEPFFSITVRFYDHELKTDHKIIYTLDDIRPDDVIASHVFKHPKIKQTHKYFTIQQIKFFDAKNNVFLDPKRTFKSYNITSDTLIIARYPSMQEPFHDLLEKKWISNVDLSAECDRELGIISVFNQQMAKSTAGAEIIDCYIVDNNRRINHEMQQQITMQKNDHMRYLFHGTSFNNVDSIIQSGFQSSYNRRSAYGEGTYVAKSAGTASQYCRRYRRECAVYAVLVCSTVIGKCVKGKRDMSFRRGAEYDTFVDSVRNPNIFVINRDYHTFAEYIILFRYLSDKR